MDFDTGLADLLTVYSDLGVGGGGTRAQGSLTKLQRIATWGGGGRDRVPGFADLVTVYGREGRLGHSAD